MNQHKIQQLLAKMIGAYDDGDAEEDPQGFLAGWAKTLAPATEPAVGKYVLVHGNPFDQGLTIEGPYPDGALDAEDLSDGAFTRYGGWWVVALDEPTLKPGE